jgi:hypothetical protein
MIGLMGAGLASTFVASAQPAPIWRCGNAYTNAPAPAERDCKPMAAPSVTVIEGTQVRGTARVETSGGDKIDATQQQQRDQAARAVLQAELQRARERQLSLQREWNQGQPTRLAGEETERYRARVTQLQQAMQRSDADVAGLQRELARHEGRTP